MWPSPFAQAERTESPEALRERLDEMEALERDPDEISLEINLYWGAATLFISLFLIISRLATRLLLGSAKNRRNIDLVQLCVSTVLVGPDLTQGGLGRCEIKK